MNNQSAIGNRQSAILASAPGSLMLLGEHAVLHGRRALVCAINKRINVFLSPINQPILRIISDLGDYEAPLGNLADHSDFRFVLDTVKQYPLEQGIEIKIESEFLSDIGFASSAAVTVATHAALMQFWGQSYDLMFMEKHQIIGLTPQMTPQMIFKNSLATVHRVQGCGSGADVAASVFGGVVAYRAEPQEVISLKHSFPLTAVYSGSKMKTVDVIRYLEERRARNPDYFERIFDRMDTSVGQVVHQIIQNDSCSRSPEATATKPRKSSGDQSVEDVLGHHLILNQKLMEKMGLCNDSLAEIIRLFNEQDVPSKISGSGLGDCVIGLGMFPVLGSFSTYALEVAPCGVFLHQTHDVL